MSTSSTHETSLLHPRSPTITNSDDWPIYTLKSSTVFCPSDPSVPLSLLHAGAYRPLTITGKLDLTSSETQFLLRKPSYHRSLSIEITDVRQFSYGQYEDGSVELWAAGKAGWFTIEPGRAYKTIYADMVEAVKLLYWTADTVKETKRPGDVVAHDIFQKYCLTHRGECNTIDGAEALFAKHRYFLFASMLDGKEGIQWTKLPLFKFLESTFPGDAALIKQRRAFAMKPPKAPSSKRSTQSPASSNASLKRKRNERAATPLTTTSTRSKSRSASVATATPSVTGTQDSPNSQTLVSRPRSRQGSRKPSLQPAATPAKPDSDADSEDSTKEHGRGHKGKSVLRPKPAKYIPGPGRQDTTTTLADGNDADDDETDEPHEPAQTSPSSKRKMLDELKPRRAKRRNSQMRIGDTDDMIFDPELNHEMGESITTPSEAYQDANEAVQENKRPVLPFRFRDGKTSEDQGDVWRCDIDGCMHRIYAASEPTSLGLIEDHKRIHEHDHDHRVQLVRRMEAPWLPVGRLMDRVRELAAQGGAPAPIVQKY